MNFTILLPYLLGVQLLFDLVVILAFVGVYRGLVGLEEDITDTNKRFRKLYDDLWFERGESAGKK